jgi:hypothetical protein
VRRWITTAAGGVAAVGLAAAAEEEATGLAEATSADAEEEGGTGMTAEEEEEATKSLAEATSADAEEGGTGVTEDEATCLATADAEEGGTGMTEDEATCLATAETTKRLAAEAGAAAVGTSTGPAGRAAGTRGRRREEAVEAALSSTSRSRR